MKEIPILFSTPMVRAILEGRKTMTRRLMKVEEECDHSIFKGTPHADTDSQWAVGYSENGFNYYNCAVCGNGAQLGGKGYKCKYGKAGDILWVRETWQWMEGFAGSGYYVFKSDFKLKDGEWQKEISNKFHDVEVVRFWKPSIHMPKEASRIWLQVTDVRVERLQDITEEDAIAEGLEQVNINADCSPEYRDYSGPVMHRIGETKQWGLTPIGSFKSLWQSINGAESWKENPWVWVISYKILSTAGKPDLQSLKAIA